MRRRALALLGAAVLTAALLAISNDGHSGSVASAAQKIAFVRTSTDPGGARLELYVINADGSGERRLVEMRFSPTTATPYELYSGPAWSPDGRKIAFVGMGDDGNTDVYVVGADGLGQQRLTRHPKVDGNPAWSPDGRKIAFTRGDREWSPGQKTHIYVMNADGSRQRRLTHGHVHFSVAWSPDGQKMLFERPNPRHHRGPVPGGGNEDLHVMNADGSGQRRLTRNPARDVDPLWSPDGRRIAFDSGSQIWLMNPNGSGKRSLTPAGWYSAESQDWSPDGRKIAFMGRPSTPPPGIFVMNADGSERRRLAQDGRNPAWSPDGQMIAFNREDATGPELYVMNADGSGKRRLLRSDRMPGPGAGLPWAWSPAQK